MKRNIMALAFLVVVLAGCGPVASPTTTNYDSHDRTMETTATQEQSNVRAGCVGLVNAGSCNVIQVNDQSAAATVSDGMFLAQFCSGGWLLLGCLIFFFVAMMFAPRS